MSWADVSDILLDPDVAGDQIMVIRRREAINNFGETVTVNQVFPIIGNAQPSGRNSLVREAAFDAQEKTIRVFTPFRLRSVARTANGSTFKPDLVWWHGDYFIVKTLDDLSNYGGGLIVADCSSIDYGDVPPWELPAIVPAAIFNVAANSELLPCLS